MTPAAQAAYEAASPEMRQQMDVILSAQEFIKTAADALRTLDATLAVILSGAPDFMAAGLDLLEQRVHEIAERAGAHYSEYCGLELADPEADVLADLDALIRRLFEAEQEIACARLRARGKVGTA